MNIELAAQIRKFIAENFVFGPTDRILDDESFFDSGILDSTGVLQLIDFLEETYEIQVANEEVTPENLDSIEKVTTYLSRKLGGSNGCVYLASQAAETGGRS